MGWTKNILIDNDVRNYFAGLQMFLNVFSPERVNHSGKDFFLGPAHEG